MAVEMLLLAAQPLLSHMTGVKMVVFQTKKLAGSELAALHIFLPLLILLFYIYQGDPVFIAVLR